VSWVACDEMHVMRWMLGKRSTPHNTLLGAFVRQESSAKRGCVACAHPVTFAHIQNFRVSTLFHPRSPRFLDFAADVYRWSTGDLGKPLMHRKSGKYGNLGLGRLQIFILVHRLHTFIHVHRLHTGKKRGLRSPDITSVT